MTSAWVSVNFTEAYVKEVNRLSEIDNVDEVPEYVINNEDEDRDDESKFIWTIDDMAKYNDDYQKETLQESGEVIRTRSFDQKILVDSEQGKGQKDKNTGGPMKIVTWIKLVGRWRPTLKRNMCDYKKKTWSIVSQDYNPISDKLPKYNPDLGDKAPLNLLWEDATESFIRSGFNSKLMATMITDLQRIAKKTKPISMYQVDTVTYNQVDCHDHQCTFVEKELQVGAIKFDAATNQL